MATVQIHAEHAVVKVYPYPSLGCECWAVTLVTDDGRDRLSLIYDTPDAASRTALGIMDGLAAAAECHLAAPA
jgi:hypothetical protein